MNCRLRENNFYFIDGMHYRQFYHCKPMYQIENRDMAILFGKYKVDYFTDYGKKYAANQMIVYLCDEQCLVNGFLKDNGCAENSAMYAFGWTLFFHREDIAFCFQQDYLQKRAALVDEATQIVYQLSENEIIQFGLKMQDLQNKRDRIIGLTAETFEEDKRQVEKILCDVRNRYNFPNIAWEMEKIFQKYRIPSELYTKSVFSKEPITGRNIYVMPHYQDFDLPFADDLKAREITVTTKDYEEKYTNYFADLQIP